MIEQGTALEHQQAASSSAAQRLLSMGVYLRLAVAHIAAEALSSPAHSLPEGLLFTQADNPASPVPAACCDRHLYDRYKLGVINTFTQHAHRTAYASQPSPPECLAGGP